MIKLENAKNLYYIRNMGCDDETCGLVNIPDEYFPIFKDFIENLNKNSTYGCMPTISVYKVDASMFREYIEDDDSDWKCLHFGDKKYAFKDTVDRWSLEVFMK